VRIATTATGQRVAILRIVERETKFAQREASENASVWTERAHACRLDSTGAPTDRIRELLKDQDTIDRAVRRGVAEAIRRHRAANVPLASLKGGRVVYLDPTTLEELPAAEAEERLRPRNGTRGSY
jgi:hypothetical protein